MVKEGAPEEARGDFELLMVAARESVKVRVAQLAARPAEKLAVDYIDQKRLREAERRDPVGEQRQWEDDGDVVMGAAQENMCHVYVWQRLWCHRPGRRQRHRNGADGQVSLGNSLAQRLHLQPLFLHVHPKFWTDWERGGA